MNILFLVYHGFSEVSGISKKIHYQVKGLRENGHEVHLCYYDFNDRGHRCRYVDGEVIRDYGKGMLAKFLQRVDYRCVYDYCKNNKIQFIYARSFQNATPFLIHLFKKLKSLHVISVTEIPTYPYDAEFRGSPLIVRLGLKVDQIFRKQLYGYMSALVTFSNATDIFGQRTIRISNGVDFDSIPLHQYQSPSDDTLHFIGVAEVHYWHGYDRMLEGIGEYYLKTINPRNVIFHIVGGIGTSEMYGSVNSQGLKRVIDNYHIEDHVVFHGQLFGQDLDKVFNLCCFAIGSLARHRSGITNIKTLKNREYASRGIPFVYSEQDSDFDNQPYVLKASPDESPINIQKIIDFIDNKQFSSREIRKTVEHLSWKNQMKYVIEQL